jgi:sulfoacetaldehyde dehydrogenase
MLNGEQKEKLRKVLFPSWPESRALGRDVIMRSPSVIARLAGIEVPEDAKLLLVEEKGTGKEYPFAGEKLSPILSVYRYNTLDDAIKLVKANLAYVGIGHSSGIHSNNEENIARFAAALPVTRIAVRQAMTASNSGSWTSGNHWTATLGCGTWGGNIVSENITYKHFLNNTWISTPIKAYIPTDDELFGNLK